MAGPPPLRLRRRRARGGRVARLLALAQALAKRRHLLRGERLLLGALAVLLRLPRQRRRAADSGADRRGDAVRGAGAPAAARAAPSSHRGRVR